LWLQASKPADASGSLVSTANDMGTSDRSQRDATPSVTPANDLPSSVTQTALPSGESKTVGTCGAAWHTATWHGLADVSNDSGLPLSHMAWRCEDLHAADSRRYSVLLLQSPVCLDAQSDHRE
jgi:hypothetical protein